jgi:hypothetical protein
LLAPAVGLEGRATAGTNLIRENTMKHAIALAASGLILFGVANCAAAEAFSPSNTKFNWTGPVIIMKSTVRLGCQATVGAQTNTTGALSITSVSFSGGQACASVGASGLPWAVKATSMTSLTISKVLLVLPNGACGSGVIPANLGGGVLAFNASNNLAGCSIAGGLRSAPTVKILP